MQHFLSLPSQWRRTKTCFRTLSSHTLMRRGFVSLLHCKTSFLRKAMYSSRMCGLGLQPIASMCYPILHGILPLRYCWREHADKVPLIICMAIKQKDKLHSTFRHRCSHFALLVGLVPKSKGLKLAGVLLCLDPTGSGRTERGARSRVRRTAINCPHQNACRKYEGETRGDLRRPEPNRRL